MSLHARVHERLCVTWFIGFVMTKSSKTNQIEYNIFIKFLPVSERDLQCSVCGFRIVTVDVEDWQLRHTSDVSRIDCGASSFWRSRETNLIVNDDVDRSTSS